MNSTAKLTLKGNEPKDKSFFGNLRDYDCVLPMMCFRVYVASLFSRIQKKLQGDLVKFLILEKH